MSTSSSVHTRRSLFWAISRAEVATPPALTALEGATIILIKEWEALEPERQIMRAIIEGRDDRDLTQKQLAEVTGITQADNSRFENGTGNSSLRTLKRLAEGLGMSLKVEFVPKSKRV